MSRIYLYSLNSIIMWLNVKEYFENGVANIQNAWKRALAILATVGALSGVLTSCNSPDVSLEGDTVSTSFTYLHSHGGSEAPDKNVFKLDIKKEGDSYIATIDGPWLDNREFSGDIDQVSKNVQDFLLRRCNEITGYADQPGENTLKKLNQVFVLCRAIE